MNKLHFAIYIQEQKGKALIPRFSAVIDLEPGEKLAVAKVQAKRRDYKNLFEAENKGG